MDFKIFDTLLEPVFVISGDKKVLYCNEPAALICELSVRKITRGGIFDQILRFAEPLTFLENLATLTDSSPYQELSFEATTGKAGKAQITCQPVAHESPAWLIYFRDVTLEETLQKKYRAELEQVQHYSKNLEKMVDERTAEIRKLNSMMTALLDSLHQGFFIFNTSGDCLEVYSKACETTIECKPAGRKIWDVLRLEQNQIPGLQKWMTTIFSEMLPFEDLSILGPQTFPHSYGKNIKLEYYPLRNADNQMDAIVVVASDITSLIEAQKEAEIERANAKMILSLVKNKRQVAGFIREARELILALQKEMHKEMSLDQENTFRYLHTLKGGASSFSIKNLADVCHEAETLLSTFKWDGINPDGLTKLKECSFQIEERFLMFQMDNSEILGNEAQLQERWIEAPVSQLFNFREEILSNFPPQAQTFTETFVMEPIQVSFEHFQEVVKSVAVNEGKTIAPVEFIGGDLRILPEPYENLFSTMIHAFRNAVDHGIETPEDRLTVGKNPEGKLVLSFSRSRKNQMDLLSFQLKDDGGGIDPARIRAKLDEKGIDCSKESDDEVIQHIFDSQFSTKEHVTETSGRGVGMDAISFAAKKLGGKTWVESKLGAGTTLFVEVPFLQSLPETKKIKKAA